MRTKIGNTFGKKKKSKGRRKSGNPKRRDVYTGRVRDQKENKRAEANESKDSLVGSKRKGMKRPSLETRKLIKRKYKRRNGP